MLALAAAVLHPVSSATAVPAEPRTDGLFAPLPTFDAAQTGKPRVRPADSVAYRVDVAGLASSLAQAPDEAALAVGAHALTLTLPDPTGAEQTFAVVESSLMAPGLAARHPEIRTYAGNGISNPTQSIRLDVTPMGFHASVRSPGAGRAWYIDPAENIAGASAHLSYFGSAVQNRDGFFIERDLKDTADVLDAAPTAAAAAGAGQSVVARTYRLALISDPSYANYFGTENVLAEKVTLMNRVNQIYNDDLAIELELIDGTDKLNFDTAAKTTEANGPCGASACYTAAQVSTCSGSLLTRNRFVLGQLIGADNYDVGHIALGLNGGGIAGLGVVGGSSKASGCTGLPFPQGDFFAIDYVAHEIGHQFGGNHTFNGTLANCSLTNRNGGTSVEPGSGSSVMAYAGICGQDNLQKHTDPYFSQRSIDEVTEVVSAEPFTNDEVQTVTLAGFDTDGDSVELTYPGRDPVTIVRGGVEYTNLNVASQIFQLTGCRTTLSGYDTDSPRLNDDGFTVTFGLGADCRSSDVQRIGIGATTGGVTGFVGVQVQGGPETNQGAVVTTGNHAPTTTAPADKTLPLRTPFQLTGSAVDPDKDALLYLWEQNNAGSVSPTGGTSLVSNTKANGPLFRVFGTIADVSAEDALTSPSPGQNLADGNPTRTFPDLAQVLAGTTNAATGACPAAPADAAAPVPAATVDCYSEFLPTADYTGALVFRLTTRDQSLIGGGTSYDDVTLALDKAAGPFLVTSQATAGASVTGGTAQTVTWAVAGTNKPTLAQNVRISLSLDGGKTFTRELAASTPNDGSQSVTIPNLDVERARIKIEAVDNYFFDVNDADFAIAATAELTLSQPADQRVQYSDAFGSPVTVTATSATVDGSLLAATIGGVPGLAITRTQASAPGVRPGTATFEISGPVTSSPADLVARVAAREPGTSGLSAEKTFAVQVVPEDAEVTFDGERRIRTLDDSASVTLSASVRNANDAAAGDITTATVDFVDRDTDQVLCSAPVTGGPSSGAAACEAELASSSAGASYTVGTLVGGNYVRDNAADDATVVVTKGAPVDETAPQTTITSGPREGRFSLKRRASFSYVSTEAGSTFRCTLDGTPLACDQDGNALRRLRTGTHVFTVAARDAAGNVDPTPAIRSYAQPFTSKQLKRSNGDWRRQRDNASYRRTHLITSTKGATLTRRVSDVERIALVVSSLPRQGRVAVYFRGQLLRKVSLSSSRVRHQRIITVAGLDGSRSGTVKIKTLTRRPVRIEGLAVFGRPSAQLD